jgi:hypothetical protein
VAGRLCVEMLRPEHLTVHRLGSRYGVAVDVEQAAVRSWVSPTWIGTTPRRTSFPSSLNAYLTMPDLTGSRSTRHSIWFRPPAPWSS